MTPTDPTLTRLSLVRATFALGLLLTTGCSSGSFQPFDEEAFRAAQARGAPILLHFHSHWCSFCRAQAISLEEALAADDLEELVLFRIDVQQGIEIELDPPVEHLVTVVVFNGFEERGRAKMTVNVQELRKLARRALDGATPHPWPDGKPGVMGKGG